MMYNKSMLSPETIRILQKDNYFQQFQEHISEKIAELDSLKGLDKLSNEQAGETARARSMALEILAEIFKPILSYKEIKEPTPLQIQKKKDQWGL